MKIVVIFHNIVIIFTIYQQKFKSQMSFYQGQIEEGSWSAMTLLLDNIKLSVGKSLNYDESLVITYKHKKLLFLLTQVRHFKFYSAILKTIILMNFFFKIVLFFLFFLFKIP